MKYLINVELEGVASQEILQYSQSLLAYLWVTHANQDIVLHLDPDLKPALILVGVVEFCRVASTQVKDLHVVFVEGLELSLEDDVYEGVG